eukprot:15070258-Heterocapsa_arctica.AAC.1
MDVLLSLGMPAFEARRTVLDIYSPPRITSMAKSNPNLGVKPGFAMDLIILDEFGNRWDFDVPSQRQRAMEKIRTEKPQHLIGSPMCTAFSCIQAHNWGRMGPGQKEKMLERARVHLHFCLELYGIQKAAG